MRWSHLALLSRPTSGEDLAAADGVDDFFLADAGRDWFGGNIGSDASVTVVMVVGRLLLVLLDLSGPDREEVPSTDVALVAVLVDVVEDELLLEERFLKMRPTMAPKISSRELAHNQ